MGVGFCKLEKKKLKNPNIKAVKITIAFFFLIIRQ